MAREAIRRLEAQAAANTSSLETSLAAHLSSAVDNLEGTYIVRVFAVFDAALRSYDRFHFHDPGRDTKISVMIDQLGKELKVQPAIREGVHRARQVRHFWAHELDVNPGPMSLPEILAFLHTFLDRFPKSWT